MKLQFFAITEAGARTPTESLIMTTDAAALSEVRDAFDRFLRGVGFVFVREDEIEAGLIAAYESRNRAVELLRECIQHVDREDMVSRIFDYIEAVDAE